MTSMSVSGQYAIVSMSLNWGRRVQDRFDLDSICPEVLSFTSIYLANPPPKIPPVLERARTVGIVAANQRQRVPTTGWSSVLRPEMLWYASYRRVTL